MPSSLRPFLWPLSLAVVQVILSSGPPPVPGGEVFLLPIDKTAHFLFFGLLATLTCRALLQSPGSRRAGLYACTR